MSSQGFDFGQIFAAAQQMQENMARAQEEAAKRTVEASAGGGMVTVKANGAREVLEVRIAREVVNPDDLPMLQDLVVAAVNAALRKSAELVQEEVAKATGGLPIPPGLF